MRKKNLGYYCLMSMTALPVVAVFVCGHNGLFPEDKRIAIELTTTISMLGTFFTLLGNRLSPQWQHNHNQLEYERLKRLENSVKPLVARKLKVESFEPYFKMYNESVVGNPKLTDDHEFLPVKLTLKNEHDIAVERPTKLEIKLNEKSDWNSIQNIKTLASGEISGNIKVHRHFFHMNGLLARQKYLQDIVKKTKLRVRLKNDEEPLVIDVPDPTFLELYKNADKE